MATIKNKQIWFPLICSVVVGAVVLSSLHGAQLMKLQDEKTLHDAPIKILHDLHHHTDKHSGATHSGDLPHWYADGRSLRMLHNHRRESQRAKFGHLFQDFWQHSLHLA